ncbi:MAG: long-chain acyl-CoA synthetase [Candidatus Azotimanducaceae bacterium]|jgi:long-chain acyl-CoA synthetase
MSNFETRNDAITHLTSAAELYELHEVELYGETCSAFKNAPLTLGDLFRDNRSDETFVVYEDERYTFNETYQKSARMGRLLVDQYKIQSGDRVAISMRNYPEWIMAFTAVTSIGAIAVTLNALWLTEEIEYGLNHSGAKLLIADQERIDRVLPFYQRDGINIIAVRPGDNLPKDIPALEDLLSKIPNCDMPEVSIDPNDDATILFTSGSTGHPKGAVSCHRNIITALLSWELDQHAAMLVAGIEPPQNDYQVATLLAVPLFHATGSHAVYLSCYRSQRKLVSMYRWSAVAAAELIEQEQISSFVAPAAMTGDLVEVAKQTNRDLSTLASVGGGGAPRAPEQVKGIAATFKKAMPNTGWGMTETNAIGAGIGGEDYLAHPGSSGRCSAVLNLKIIDESGNELPANSRGELLVRGTSVIKEYWDRPDANAEAFSGRWLHTGDVAYLDDEGYLYIVDRIKDLVIRGGENIGCAEVEAALLSHPDILEASAYAVPDERLGEEIGATVYVETTIDLDELKVFLSEHIAKFKIPRYVEVVTEPLLRIASGKIDKRRIRETTVAKMGL